jgi:transglutaminase-like putative cysteine protease
MRYQVSHLTRYTYDAEVTTSHGEVRQLPGDLEGQVCLERSVTIEPSAGTYRERVDWFGNETGYFSIHDPHTELVVRASSLVDTSGRPESFGPAGDQPWDVAGPHGPELVDFLLDSPLVERTGQIDVYAASSFTPGRPLAEAVLDLVHRINTDFVYVPGATDVDTPLGEFLALRRGVCQDFAHLMVGCLRSTGLPAAYVSGYLETDPPPGQPRLIGADRTHAWAAVHTADGWIGVDPTNDQVAGSRYVASARGRDYSDVPPLKGVIYTESTRNELHVVVDVTAVEGTGST